MVAAPATAWSELDHFITRAFEFGRQAFEGADHRLALRLGQGWFSFSESSPLLADDALFCLGPIAAEAGSACVGRVYADYSG